MVSTRALSHTATRSLWVINGQTASPVVSIAGMSLDSSKSDPAGINWRDGVFSDLDPLTSMDVRDILSGVSFVAFGLSW